MENTPKDATYIIERMQVSSFPRAYVLGCRATRVTVLSQQYRAFNLVWALFAAGRLKAGDRVGVIGGGIGGLTAAAAAMLMGCSVVLAEERQQLMHLQRRSTTRYLHPNIYEWPHPGSEEDTTRFPCLNWTADYAGEVVDRLDNDWAALDKRYKAEIHMQTKVTAIEVGTDGRLILRNHDVWKSDPPCDAVIVAVGFGVEPPVPGLSLASYWEGDSLELTARGGQAIKRVFVSGPGDGGCIDVLRLVYTNFQHAKFAATVSRLRELDPYKQRLLDVDNNLPEENPAGYLREQYQSIKFPADLAERFGELRTDTHVVLNGSDPSPLSPNASILHRLAIWSLVSSNKINYKHCKIDKSAIRTEGVPGGIKYWVPIQGTGLSGFDTVVMRHGPLSCLNFLPEIERGYVDIKENAAKDKTRRQLYPDGFYPAWQIQTATTLREPSSYSHGMTENQGSSTVSPIPLASVTDSIRIQEVVVVEVVVAEVAEIEELTRTLTMETQAANYPDAKATAVQLDELLIRLDKKVPDAVWRRCHSALCEYELFVKKRMESGSERYDLGRLRQLIRRMARGTE